MPRARAACRRARGEAAAAVRGARGCRRSPRRASARRCAARRGDDALDRFIESSGAVALGRAARGRPISIHRFQSLLDAIHDSPDEAAALQVIAADLLAAVDACSVVIRSAALGKPAAAAGRPGRGEEALTQSGSRRRAAACSATA